MELSRKRLCIGISLLAGAMGVVLGMVLALNGLTATIGQKMALLLCTLVIWGAGAAVLLKWDLLGKVEYTALGLLMLLLGLCLRMALLDYMSPDYNTFLSQWVATMKGMTVQEALSTPIGDYNMPYLYLLLVISRLPIRDLYGIKLFSILADVASALAVAALVRYLTKKDGAALLAFLAALFCPTTWLNSSYWGQCDSVYGALGLWALCAGLQKRSKTCYLLFALSFSFKLQAVFLLPMAAVLLGCGKIRLKDVWAFPAGFVGASLPALLAGRSLSNTFSIYFSQTQSYPYLSLNAPSFWSLIDNNYFSDMAGAPVLIAMSLSLGLLLLALWHGERLPSSSDKADTGTAKAPMQRLKLSIRAAIRFLCFMKFVLLRGYFCGALTQQLGQCLRRKADAPHHVADLKVLFLCDLLFQRFCPGGPFVPLFPGLFQLQPEPV